MVQSLVMETPEKAVSDEVSFLGSDEEDVEEVVVLSSDEEDVEEVVIVSGDEGGGR